MRTQHIKTAIIGGWVLGLGALGVSIDVNSMSGWMLLIGLGVLPPVTFLKLWQQPVPSMSERIREGLR
jgi:hypothetical protein